jgi:hypothetical protein
VNKIALTTVLLCATASVLAAPPPHLREAIQQWAAPGPVGRFEFSLVDLNNDKMLDAVVRITDPDRCGNGGCVLLMFKGTAEGYEQVGDSGYVAKPIYVLKEAIAGWTSLAGVVGLGQGAGVRPIRYMGTEYRSNPIMRGQMEFSRASQREPDLGPMLSFEVVEQVAADNSLQANRER